MITEQDIELLYEVAGMLEDNGFCADRARLEELAARIDATKLLPCDVQELEQTVDILHVQAYDIRADRLGALIDRLKGKP